MRPWTVAAAVIAAACVTLGGTVPAAGQTAKKSRTPWGHPDLEGIWNNSTITPLERPKEYAGREFLTEEEVRKLDEAAAVRYDQRSADAAQDVDAAYNQFWWERGQTVKTRRTSLIVDPPDGRIPAMTPEGTRRAEDVAARLRAVTAGPEDRNLAERCITRGAPSCPAATTTTSRSSRRRPTWPSSRR
jgi:hypothetical protein